MTHVAHTESQAEIDAKAEMATWEPYRQRYIAAQNELAQLDAGIAEVATVGQARQQRRNIVAQLEALAPDMGRWSEARDRYVAAVRARAHLDAKHDAELLAEREVAEVDAMVREEADAIADEV